VFAIDAKHGASRIALSEVVHNLFVRDQRAFDFEAAIAFDAATDGTTLTGITTHVSLSGVSFVVHLTTVCCVSL
jgi:hypothetical protein